MQRSKRMVCQRTFAPGRVLLASIALGCSSERMNPDLDRTPAAVSETHLVVLVLDGVGLDESLGTGTSSVSGEATESFLPTFRERYLAEGTRVTGAVNVGVTITTEAHVELVTGRRQPLATFERASTDTYRSDVPTLFEVVRKDRDLSRLQVAVYTNSVVVEDTTWSLYPTHRGLHAPTYVHNASNAFPGGLEEEMDRDLLGLVQSHMEEFDTHMMLVNLHGMDLAAHMGEETAYLDMVRNIDQPLTEFMAFIEGSETYGGNTMVAVVADHGRHRLDVEEDWRNHGDQCLGCRQVPLFLWGPDVVQGSVLDEVVTMADLTQTFAAWMGVELPHGHGRFLEQVFEEAPVGRSVQGEWGVDAAGGVVAVQRWGEEVRSEIIAMGSDEIVLSESNAFTAEAPRVAASADLDSVCWRMLPDIDLASTTDTHWEWEPHCAVQTSESGWEAIGFPDDAVSAYWAPAMVIDEQGTLWVVSDDNPNGYAGMSDVRPMLAQWHPESGWTTDANASRERSLPTDLSAIFPTQAVGSDAELLVAMAFSADHDHGRDTRSIGVERITVTDEGAQTWTEVLRLEPTDGVERRERPSLGQLDGTVGVAHLGYESNGVVNIQVSVSGDAGDSWSEAETLDRTGLVLGHIRPVWGPEGQLVWARLSGTVEICTAWGLLEGALADGTPVRPTCSALDSAVIDALAIDETGIWVSVLSDAGVYQTVPVEE